MRAENLLVLIQLEALVTEREGMIVANATRARNDYAPAYGEAEFFGLMDRINALRCGVVS